MSTYDVAALKGGQVYDFTYDSANISSAVVYSALDWGTWTADSTIVVEDVIKPTLDDAETSLAGSWEISVPLTEPVVSVHVRWVGVGVTLTYTLDRTTYLPLTQGQNIDVSALTDPDLDIKVTFAGGQVNDPAHLESLSVYALATNTIEGGTRDVQFSKITLSEGRGHQLTPRVDEGFHAQGGAYVDIMPDTSDVPTNVAAVEFWLKGRSLTNSVVFEEDSGTGHRLRFTPSFNWNTPGISQVMVNGAVVSPSAFTPVVDTWYHMRLTFNAARNVKLRFGAKLDGTEPANIDIFGLALYATAPTGTYAANIASPKVTVTEANAIVVTEPVPGPKIYAYAWTNTGT